MNRVRSLQLAIVLGIILWGTLGHAQRPFGLGSLSKASPTATREVVVVKTFWSADAARPGDTITLAVELTLSHPWHINANTAQSPFIATRIELREPPTTIQASTAVYPESEPLSFGSGAAALKVPVFSGKATILLPMRVGAEASPGEIPLTLTLRLQACDDKTCLPPEIVEQAVTLTIMPSSSAVTPSTNSVFQKATAGESLTIPFFGVDFTIDPTQLWLLWLVAIAGGFLLNFTPCVLPVIPIKIMSLAKAAENRRRCMIPRPGHEQRRGDFLVWTWRRNRLHQ